MNPEKTNSPVPKPEPTQDEVRGDRPVDEGVQDFLQKIPGSFRWPKPNDEAVAAAVEAIHRMSGGEAVAQELVANASREAENVCASCRGALPPGAHFCVWCGISVSGDAAVPSHAGAAQTHIHHHYHHQVAGAAMATAAPAADAEQAVPRGRPPGAAGASGGRAEAGARKVVLDWAQACNTKHIDDLIELYAANATLIRSSVPPVRSLPAIREFLISLLEAGLGDVEMESLRVEVMGDIAIDLGRCKMLVPIAMGKRREERGKYLVVMVRQPVGTWKIYADCWSTDLAVAAPPDAAGRRPNEPVLPPRKPR